MKCATKSQKAPAGIVGIETVVSWTRTAGGGATGVGLPNNVTVSKI